MKSPTCTTFLLISSPLCCLRRVKMDSCLLRSIRWPNQCTVIFRTGVCNYSTLLTNAWSMEEGFMTKIRRCHLCLASGGTSPSMWFALPWPETATGPQSTLCAQETSQRFSYGKHLRLCQSWLLGQVGCSWQLCSQLPDCRERLLPLSARCFQ